MKKRMILSVVSLVLVISIMFSFSVPTFAALSGTVTGVMQDTSVPGSGKLYWSYTYNKLTGKASLKITGNGYMPNGTDQDWFAAEVDAGCYIYDVTIGEGVKSIMSGAFAGEIYLTEISLPSTIERIGESAFAYTSVKELHIPSKVNYLDGQMFANSAIEKFSVASANPYYRAYGGHIYSKDYKTFVAVAPGKFQNPDYKFSLNKNTTTIGKYAFYNCPMTSFTVPYHIKEIKKGAFDGCSELSTLSIQNGVEAIYDNAFYDCSKLRNVHLPSSVTYLGNYSLGYKEVIAYDGITQLLDEQGISHPAITYSNYEYYAELAGYSGSMFVYPSTDISFTVYAVEGSVGEQYAKRNGTNYVKASNMLSVQSTSDGVLIKWNYSEDVSSYTVYRKKAGGSWETLQKGIDGAVTSFVDKTPYKNADNIYTIRVYYNTGLNDCDLNGKSVHYVTTPKLTSIKNELKGIRINWTVTDGLKYNYIYRASVDSGSWKCIARVGGTVKTYVDTSASPDVQYKYTVRAYDGVGLSSFVKDGISTRFVEYPKFTLKNTAKGVTVKWTKLGYADGYRIYRKTTGGWTILDTVSGDKGSFVDTTAKSGTTYTYTVRAISDGVYSSYTSSKILALGVPTLKSAGNTVKGVKVTWGKVTGAKGYFVYRKLSDGSWKRIGNVKSGSAVTFTDTTAANNTTCVYTVIAYNGSYASTFNGSGVKTKFVSAPKVSSAVSTKSGIRIKYNAISGADSYRIYRKTVNGSWQLLGTVKKGTTSYLDKTAKKGQTYIYTVRACNGSYRSSYYSNAVKVKDIY